MSGVRAFVEADIPRVAELHRLVMKTGPEMTPALFSSYRDWMVSTFLEHPARIHGVESLVFEHHEGIVGFLGVVGRLVSIDNIVSLATVGTNFCVHAEHRGPVGFRLLRAYLSRRGDLGYSDEVSDRAAEFSGAQGGVTAAMQSVRWVLPLRPAERFFDRVRHRVPRVLVGPARQVARVLDAAARGVPHSPFRFDATVLPTHPLSTTELERLLTEFGSATMLRPFTPDGSTAWLLDRARRMTQHGELVLRAVESDKGGVVGWYMYYAASGRQGEVLQIAATRSSAQHVLDTLCSDAINRGVVSLTGALSPFFLEPLASRWAIFAPAQHWVVLHTDNVAIREAFWGGHVLLSRLDGEWCLHFR
jgi:hypothetical protein